MSKKLEIFKITIHDKETNAIKKKAIYESEKAFLQNGKYTADFIGNWNIAKFWKLEFINEEMQFIEINNPFKA